jgi:CSLREA domain-containing protein
MMRLTHNRVAASRLLALGTLLAALMAAFVMLVASQAHATTTFYVNSTADYGDANLFAPSCDTGNLVPGTTDTMEAECTLRAAIQQANHTAGSDTINFVIPGSGVHTIAPATGGLPEITGPVSINGYSQPGSHPNTKAVGTDAVLKIELSGASAPSGDGLVIEASNSTVKGLVINRWRNVGILINTGATGNKVEGNYIGTDPSGNKGLGASGDGVRISAAGNTVGGTTAGARNVISAHDEGVVIVGNSATGNKVEGNHIGTDPSGTKDLGNDTSGVTIVGAPNNTIGGTTAATRNVIAFNDGAGVAVIGQSATGNRVLSNSIYSTPGLGIDLGSDGPTANDPGDADNGPNNLQNKPRVTSAKTGGGKTTVSARLSSTPTKTFTVQFFSNPSGTDEGKTFIGQKSVTTDKSGEATFAFSPAQKVGSGRTVTATATNPTGSTSEFSAPRTLVSS